MPTHTLKKPVILEDGRQFVVIDIPEPTLGGLAAHEMAMVNTGSETAAMIAMLAAETNWPTEAVRKIAQSEMEALGEIMRPFVESDPSKDGEP